MPEAILLTDVEQLGERGKVARLEPGRTERFGEHPGRRTPKDGQQHADGPVGRERRPGCRRDHFGPLRRLTTRSPQECSQPKGANRAKNFHLSVP